MHTAEAVSSPLSPTDGDGGRCDRSSYKKEELVQQAGSGTGLMHYLTVCVPRLAGGERKGGTSSQEHHSWSAATTTQSAASSAGQ